MSYRTAKTPQWAPGHWQKARVENAAGSGTVRAVLVAAFLRPMSGEDAV